MNEIDELLSNPVDKPNLDTSLLEIAELYNLQQEKDIFLYFYWERLSKRMSLQNSVSLETDIKLVTLLKKVCYTNTLRKISSLMQDYEISKELIKNYDYVNELVVLITILIINSREKKHSN